MRDDGLPIAWDDRQQSYNYEEEVSIQFSVTIGDKELMRIRGGKPAQQNIFEKKWQSAGRLHSRRLILSLKAKRQIILPISFPRFSSYELRTFHYPPPKEKTKEGYAHQRCLTTPQRLFFEH